MEQHHLRCSTARHPVVTAMNPNALLQFAAIGFKLVLRSTMSSTPVVNGTEIHTG